MVLRIACGLKLLSVYLWNFPFNMVRLHVTETIQSNTSHLERELFYVILTEVTCTISDGIPGLYQLMPGTLILSYSSLRCVQTLSNVS
jgi:hypothetical protein